MATIKVIDDRGAVVDTEPAATPSDPSTTITPDGKLMEERVAQMFDLRPAEVSKYSSKINTLIEYAKLKTQDHSPEGIKWAIRSLGTKLGTPPLGEKLLPYLTRFAYLELESNKINKEKSRYLMGGSDAD